MRCARCDVKGANARVTIGDVVYALCGGCAARIDHPAHARDYQFPGQVVKSLARTARRWDNTAARWRRA